MREALASVGRGLENFMLFNKTNEPKKKKGNESISRQSQISTTFFRQSDTFKKVLNNLFTEQIVNEKYIKMEICSIFDFFFDYLKDFYLKKNKEYFLKCIEKNGFIENIKTGKIDSAKQIKEEMHNFIKDNVWQLLPPISKTGTSLDIQDEIFQEQAKFAETGLSVDNILGFSILPTVILLFSLNEQNNN